MKKLILLISLIFCFSFLIAVQYTLTPRYISETVVEADLSIYNNTSQDIQWTFPNSSWITLLIDGQSSCWGGFDILVYVNIPTGSTITPGASYGNNGQLSLGHHTAQAALYFDNGSGFDWFPVGDPVDILVHNLYDSISFDLNVGTTNQDSISAVFIMTNNDVYEFRNNYQANWFTLYLDGVAVNPTASQAPGNLTMAPGGEFASNLVIYPPIPLSYGQHRLVMNITGYGALPSQSFYITNPSANEEQTASPFSSKIYPNPFRDAINISYVKDTSGSFSLEVYNIKGQLVSQQSIPAKAGKNEITWNGKDKNNQPCPAGVYILSLQDGKTVQNLKCMKVRVVE